MPIYEYECIHCGHTLEAIQKFSDPALTDCPGCHTANLRKKVSAAAFHLKGGGWYVTDFKNNKPKDNGKPAQEATTKAANKTEIKTGAAESAPAPRKSEPATSG